MPPPGYRDKLKFTDYYQDNILNRYDSYTYKWKMMMVHPDQAHRFEEVAKPDSDRVVVMAESGVEAEINIQTVNQSLVLAFKGNRDRSGLANMFSMNLVEPGGATFFNRIILAANRLGIENHLHACYLLELKFIGYNPDGTVDEDMVGPFYYVCNMTGLTFDYADGATSYRADLIETHQEAFRPQMLHLKQDMGTFSASTFGEFLQTFQERLMEQELSRVTQSTTISYPTEYKFDVDAGDEEWKSWAFGSSTQGGTSTDLGGTSVTGTGKLSFTFEKGTAVSDAIIVALLHTDNMRKLPTAKGGFHKESANQGEAKALTFADLSKWYVFRTETKYLKYDYLQKRYQKEMTYKIKSHVVSELIHDPLSYDQVLKDPSLQKRRIGEIFKKGLLAKRFDYTYTGLNTEVLSLDVSLQNTYFQLQALNHGYMTSRIQNVSPEGGPTEELNILRGQSINLANDINKLKSEVSNKQNELEKLRGTRTEQEIASGFNEGRFADLENSITRNKLEIKRLAEKKVETDRLWKEEYKNLPQGTARELAPVSKRYITQSELLGGAQPEETDKVLPLTFDDNQIKSKATGDATPDSKNQGAFMLGAVEINLNSMADLVQQMISVRGDPYWLGAPKGMRTSTEGANYATGGVHYFLNMNFPTYPDQESGLMDVAEQNFGIIGMYRVTRVDATYSDGQFTMTLQSFRDVNTNVGFTIDELMSGRVADNTIKSQAEEFKQQDEKVDNGDGENNEPVIEESTGDQSDLGPVDGLNGGASGTYTEDQSTIAGVRKLAVASDLSQMLTNVAAETGVDIQVRSGGQDDTTGRPGGASRRHDNGHAADVALYVGTGSNRRRLRSDRAEDLPFIQSVFESARKQGVTGFGAGNGYMGNNVFHLDNAAKYGQGTVAVWGGYAKKRVTAPQWLQTFGKKLG
tara:strand:+ start:1477 stop:4230 length:2754 start_codon:yes stop_codon:yes gene_type:complete